MYVCVCLPDRRSAICAVSSGCVAEYKGEPLRTAGGVVTVRTLTSASIR